MKNRNPEFKLSAVLACPCVMFCAGFLYLWSVFQQPVIDHYGWDVSAVTMISSAMLSLYVVGSLIGGFVSDRKSPRFSVSFGSILGFIGLFATSLLKAEYPWMIYVTYGLLAGIGTGFSYSGALNCIQKWFPQRRGFASGVTVCAFGLSAIVLAPFIEWLIRSFGVPATFRIMAFIFPVVSFIAAQLLKPPSKAYLDSLDLPAEKAMQRQYEPREVIKTPEFWFISVSTFFLPAAYMMIIPRIKTLAAARGISAAQASLTVSLTGAASAVSRIVGAALSDKYGRAVTLWGISLLMLIAAVCMTFAGGWFYTVVVLLIVAGYTGPAGIFPSMCTDVFGTKHAGANFGMCLLFVGFASAFFPWLSTVINAAGAESGNYTASFMIAAGGCVVPLALLPIYEKARKKRAASDFEEIKRNQAL
ncbi:MAG: OFA family MFS transporter [Oscillospiraceae bacterium]|nr:OFA family MFS transporter [Oscillospiraceae bacterium]